MVGSGGLFTVNVRALEVPLFGFVTVTAYDPAVARSNAGIETIIWYDWLE